jgi:prepilin-type N-terminal cleavage/methylation domain-containing protein/prepilin-type processing-associated H-X9-DG protein
MMHNSGDAFFARSPSKGRRGVTLIELLVAIAVITVLLSVLLPAIGQARGVAQMMVGASNVRQLQIANLAYASEHRGHFVPAASNFLENLHRWHGARATDSIPFEPRDGAITPYLDERSDTTGGVRVCPRFAGRLDELRDRDAGFEAGAGGYGYNAAFVGQQNDRRRVGETIVYTKATDRKGSRDTDFDQPTQTLAFADAAFAADELIAYSFIEPVFWPGSAQQYRPDPSMHFRHVGERANVAWLDGHVTQRRFGRSHHSGLYPVDPEPLRVGWFGEADSNASFDYD